MSLCYRILLLALSIIGLILFSPASAQAPQMPDCTGISDVSDYDGAMVSDFVGDLTTVRVASGLDKPLFAGSPPDRADGPDDRLFIIEKKGTIRILDLTTYQLLPGTFLDIQTIVKTSNTSFSEEGLLGLAFHPDYNATGAANEGMFFVYYTNNSGNNQVSRFGLTAPNDADESSEAQVIEILHPTYTNHNGGPIAFGSDGHLYIGTGDGGGSCDSTGSGQNKLDLRGKILRLDVDSLPYSTAGNPYDGPTTGLDEIWSYGLRNPWRISFDRGTGALYIGDVGQSQREEINCQPSASTGGENYGWLLYEGNTCPNLSCGGAAILCNTITHTKNILEYDHTLDGLSRAIVSGYVYRGCRMSDLHGSMYFTDNTSNNIRTFRTDGSCAVLSAATNRTTDLAPGGGLSITNITSFGEDSRGEIYICDQGGEVFKVLPELSIMEVSGQGASHLRVDSGSLDWEDLRANSGHDITSYKVYRSDSGPTGPFECVFTDPDTTWSGGDPGSPPSGDVFYYLVTALNGAGVEARPGNYSDGTARTVDTSSICP